MFYDIPTVSDKYYAGDFSRLHANEMTFSPYISFDLKQRLASRMLDYPDTFADDPLLGFALQNLASRSALNFLLYDMSVPVGQLQALVIRLQDHWEVMRLDLFASTSLTAYSAENLLHRLERRNGQGAETASQAYLQ